MKIDSDELKIATSELQGEVASTAESIRDAVIKTVVGAIPLGIGSVVTNLVVDTADQRWKSRVTELFSMFADRVSQLQDAIGSQEYFGSEEFQALIIEAIDQERTNRHKEKRAMLAQGLANSGTREFVQDDTKETFFRMLRDLSPTDINLLDELSKPLERSQHNSLGGVAARAIDPRVSVFKAWDWSQLPNDCQHRHEWRATDTRTG